MGERRTHREGGIDRRSLLMRTASVVALAPMLVSLATPAWAQLAARRGAALATASAVPRATAGGIRSAAATDALNRQASTLSRAQQIRTMATQARAAIARSVPNGLQGLVVAKGVTANALAAGALSAARDSTGRMTWQGANLPVETVSGDSVNVTITQTESRAILSWDRFDVGSQTTLQFDQKINGVGQKDWVAVNRVVDPNAAPSQILGQIKADGTVVAINRNGMIFGSGARVNANSLLASSLDIGNFVKPVSGFRNPDTGNLESGLLGTTLQERNIAFLQNGLLQPDINAAGASLGGMLTSSLDSRYYSSNTGGGFAPQFDPVIEGAVTVERGAAITAGTGGFVIFTAPSISNDGTLSADDGQVSLQAGRAITANVSTGIAGKANEDPFIRGLILRTLYGSGESSAVNSGLIETKRGYASLGAAIDGSVTNSGLITATTSVSRNGAISLTAGTVSLTGAGQADQASGLVILPDDSGETIPQGTTGLPESFKQSQIAIGAIYIDPRDSISTRLGELGPAAIDLGLNSLVLAPNANVEIGGKAGRIYSNDRYSGSNIPGAIETLAQSRISIASGALIDVSGVKDVALDASRNSLKIDPLKRNELRDTPNYRETNTSGNFTLNGATVYVDPRVSGVRDDGVAYVGSPLIEAGSAASQIGVTARELMTRGGEVSLNVATLTTSADPITSPRITVDAAATIDFSGGWVRYLDGVVRTSRLVTPGGLLVDIGSTDRNGIYIAVGEGFTEVQAKFGISRNYAADILQGLHFEAGYDEGRDAGALSIGGSNIALDATLWGNAFAGARQLSGGEIADVVSAGDIRRLQGGTGQIPSGGLLQIGNYGSDSTNALAGDVVIGKPAGAVAAGTIVLDDARISQAGLSGLKIATSASVSLLAGADLRLANGGAMEILAGRAIALDGNITIPSGSIGARTLTAVDIRRQGAALATTGSPFRADDDIFVNYASAVETHPFDITVAGRLSTAGLWANDLTSSDYTGSAFINGGSITLDVAPNAFFGVGGTANEPLSAVDFSGSIQIDDAALLDVSSGGYVGLGGSLNLSGKGGDIALINRTRYASTRLTSTEVDATSTAQYPIGGANQSVQFTPYAFALASITPALVPLNQQAEVAFSAGSLRGFGFAGGGTFTLVAPDIAMGSASSGKGPRIGLDFLQRTGFGTLDLAAYKSRLVPNLFDNGRDGLSAFLEVSRFEVGAGETLDLTQAVLPSLLDAGARGQLSALATGADIYSLLTPTVPVDAWDRLAANLKLGGLTELDVAAGGTVIGAATASITVPRLYNAGTIRLAGGTINQVDPFQGLVAQRRLIGVLDASLGGGGLADVLGGGTPDQTSGFDENALLKADVFSDRAKMQRLTNGELFSAPGLDAILVYTGRVGLNEGVHLTSGSTIDLSGTAIYNPRSEILRSGQQLRSGRVIAGGTLRTSRLGQRQAADGYSSVIDPANLLVGDVGATIRLDGASATFDEQVSRTSFASVAHWSNGGTLAIGNGAQLFGVTLSARGGDDGDGDLQRTKATGGVLDWAAPTLRQDLTSADATGASLSSNQIMAAGFDTLVARGGIDFAGPVDLRLRKAFIATTKTIDGQLTADSLAITTQEAASGSITAPYVRFESSNRMIGAPSLTNGTGNVAFNASAIDIAGSALFNVTAAGAAQPGSVTLAASGDIRLIGAADLPDSTTGLFAPGITGQLVSTGDLTLTAAQVYATTGTGNLQQLLEDRRAGVAIATSPYIIASTHTDGHINFARTSTVLPDTPLSAGSYLAVRGANISQDGVLRAPLGMLDIGSNDVAALGAVAKAPATLSLSFGADSLTSVSARTSLTGSDALAVPYGTTTDLIEYFFSPGTSKVLSTLPAGELRFAGRDIAISSAGAGDVRVDGRGGGDVFAFEFIPGTGGSRDVLDRLNADAFSGTNGLQFPDGRQVYAILPKNAANVALYDPIYSADYSGGGGVALYGLNAGMTVRLDAAPGIEAGEYLLLPAHYALLPGAMRIVENVGAVARYSGGATTLLDGSVVVGGRFGTAGTDLVESTRRSFTIQSQDVFSKYSRIETTSGSKTIAALAERNGLSLPRLPRDAARVVLAPLTTLRVAGAFATDPGAGGLGSEFDIGGSKVRIAAAGALPTSATSDYVLLTTDTLANFNANSLSIGALRTNNVDGTTTLDVVTQQLLVDNDVIFSAPELLLAVGGVGSLLSIADAPRNKSGAVLSATGTLNDQRTGDYIINATAPRDGSVGLIDQTGSGALIRLSTGPERLVTRQGDYAARNTLLPARLDIGAGASLRGASITLDSSRSFGIDKTVQLGGYLTGDPFDLVLSSDALRLGGFTFAPEVEAQFGRARHLTYRSPDILSFAPGNYRYNDLTIDAGGIGYANVAKPSAETSDVQISADHLALGNSSKDVGACADPQGIGACSGFGSLKIDARDITFFGGQLRTKGFAPGLSPDAVVLRATEGMYVTGSGGFNTLDKSQELQLPIRLLTPFIVDRSDSDITSKGYVKPDYTFASLGSITVSGTGLAAVKPLGDAAPGARIAFTAGVTQGGGDADVSITDTLVRATAGRIEVSANGSVTLGGTTSLEAAGFSKTFDDGLERTTVSAGGGNIRLLSTAAGGVIDTSAQSRLVIDNGVGAAGGLDVTASLGEVNLRSQLNPDIAADAIRSASFKLDTGLSSFSLSDFVANVGNRFQGDLVIRSADGDLALATGQVLRADSVHLTADGGQVRISGTIDTSGDNVQGLALTDPVYKNARIDGGAIGLFGREGVSLTSTGALVSTTSGYGAEDTRQAKGGQISIGIGISQDPSRIAMIDIASGATIDVSALRSGDRRVAEIAVDPQTGLEATIYRLAQSDVGGTVALRAPVLTDNRVGFANAGAIAGASELQFEGYRRFDLDAIADSGNYAGVTLRSAVPDFIMLDAGEIISGKANFLADVAAGTIPDFVQNFNVSTTSGTSLAAYRVRPGVELASANEVRFANGWNLAAGQIVNVDGSAGYADALAAGLLKLSPLGPYTSGPLAGQQRYEVVAGAEAELFSRFVGMTYRVGGSVRGEAPIVTLRSAQTIDIAHSISDGFFTFHDLTNPDFIDYQLGGGSRTYNPALRISCGSGDAASCGDSLLNADAPTGIVAGPAGTRVTINVGTALQGEETSQFFINAPYNALANSAAPSATGDPFGVAELFPRLTDGSAVHSSDLRIVGGAQLGSVNPLQVDYNQTGSVKVSGETSYAIAGTKGTSSLAGHFQFGFGLPGNPTEFFDIDELLDLLDSGDSSEFNADYYTVLNWGTGTTGAVGAARTAALAYEPFQLNGHLLGSSSNPTGISARLRDVVAFFRDSGFGQTYADGVAAHLPGYNSPASLLAPLARLANPTAFVGTVVRTGDGRIDVAAAGDIDLRRTATAVMRKGSGTTSTFQVGSNAIYTAGVRVAESSLRGAVLPGFSGYSQSYVPGSTSSVLLAPVFAENGGDITLTAGGDVIGRRDVWGQMSGLAGSEIIVNSPLLVARGLAVSTGSAIGSLGSIGSNLGDQAWRYGIAGFDNVQAGISPGLFTSGVGALSGGDVTIRAGRDVTDLTVALDNSLVTSLSGGSKTLIALGAGDLSVQAGRNLAGGQFDIASGVAGISVGGDVVGAGQYDIAGTARFADNRNLLRLRISDATVSLRANGSIAIGGIGALYAAGDISGRTNAEFFSPIAGVDIRANGAVDLVQNRNELYYRDLNNNLLGTTLAPSLEVTSLFDDISMGSGTQFGSSSILAPSRYGQLTLLAGGDIANLSLAMSDAAPRNFFGQSANATLSYPRALASSSDAELRSQHDRHILHLADRLPVRIIADGSISQAVISLPKQARIRAGEDIVNLQFQGQNLTVDDVTRISAGRDIIGTVGVSNDTAVQGRSGVQGNNISIGGPGSLFVEAGRNLGPFVTSATGTLRSEAGGIRTVGNELNPWLGSQGANIYALFGVGGGADYAALESTYLDPANLGKLDGDLFEQKTDELGNKKPDRSKYSYAPVLAEWLRTNAPEAFAAVFGTTPPTGDDLKNASYANYNALYSTYAGIDQLTRNRFLIDDLYFRELAAPSDPNGNSYNQFVRGYRAVQTLFPPSLGYTDNLAAYTTDPSTVNEDHPLGVPTRNLVNGTPVAAERVNTGSVDLRLSTIETTRGGNISILGPGGDFVAGSVVRTEAQVNRRVTAFNVSADTLNLATSVGYRDLLDGNFLAPLTSRGRIASIPQGFEGILTLRGGQIRSFTDGSFVLNQSRLFTQRSGDITMWSSNGDLNAGQGPRSSSNFPPIVLRFSPNGSSEVDSAGSVSGAGIGAFKASPSDPDSAIRLIAPVGTVDAGDAGVRATGSIFVAAARVVNADSFSAGGSISGVPALTATTPPPAPAAAASAVVANAFRAANAVGNNAQRASRIFVDVLGYFGESGDSQTQSQSDDGNGEAQ